MKINVHIERLILEGLPVSGHEGPRVGAAVEAELARLFGHHGISQGLQAGGAFPSLRADQVRLAAPASPRQIGRQIARSVYGGFERER